MIQPHVNPTEDIQNTIDGPIFLMNKPTNKAARVPNITKTKWVLPAHSGLKCLRFKLNE